MERMTNSTQTTPTAPQPLDEKNLLPLAEESAGSCCGGGSCSS